MPFNVILIGPIGAGKSTQGELLSEKLKAPYRKMDELRWDYYREIGYSEELEKKISDNEGFLGVYRYWKPFEAHAVERLLEDFPDGVLDFGGGHSVYEDEALFKRVQKAMNPFGNVVLLLPSPDLDESVRILRTGKWDGIANNSDLHEHFVKHHSNHDLAKINIYTKDKSPEETCDEILSRIRIAG